MRVLNNKYVRVFLIVCLILSFALSSAFAASYSVPYAEPPTGNTTGYISLAFSSGNIMTYWWSCNGSSIDSMQVSTYVDIELTSNTIDFDFHGLPSSADYRYSYNLSRRTGSKVWLMGSGLSAGISSLSHNFSSLGSVIGVTYGGNVGTIIGLTDTGSASISFADVSDSYLYSNLELIYGVLGNIDADIDVTNSTLSDLIDSVGTASSVNKEWLQYIFDRLALTNVRLTDLKDLLTVTNVKLVDLINAVDSASSINRQWLQYIFDRLELTNLRLTTIKDLLEEWGSTTLDESTSPLPNQGLNDFESSQDSLRNESDVSNNLDSVFNDADFGSFSNGFNVIWSLVDSVLNTNPIFFSLVILVLTLGLLNLIFNRR